MGILILDDTIAVVGQRTESSGKHHDQHPKRFGLTSMIGLNNGSGRSEDHSLSLWCNIGLMTPIEFPPLIHSAGTGTGNKGTDTTSLPVKKSVR